MVSIISDRYGHHAASLNQVDHTLDAMRRGQGRKSMIRMLMILLHSAKS